MSGDPIIAQVSPVDAERIRTQERNKLQGKIDTLEGRVNGLEQENTTLKASSSSTQSTGDDLTAVLGRLESTLTRAKPDSKQAQSLSEIKTMLSSLTKVQQQSGNGAQSQEFQSLQAEILDLKTQSEKSIRDLWRSESLRKAGPNVIEALVQGNTQKDIEASVEKAKEEYTKLAQQVLSEAGVTASPVPPEGTPPVVASSTSEPVTPSVTPPIQGGEINPSNAQAIQQPQQPVPVQQLIGSGPEPVVSISQNDLVARLNSITDPVEKIEFFQKNQVALKTAAAQAQGLGH